MITKFKKILKRKRGLFQNICKSNNINLNYTENFTEFEILKNIFYEREYSDFFPFYQKVTIMDIGAHYGYFSIFASNNTDKDSEIIAIEPSKNNFKNLIKNISDCKIDNIKCFNIAIGDKNGISKLYAGKNPNHSIIKNYKLANNKYEEVEEKTLETIINELNLNKIDFLKIDCEGAEYQIFDSTPDSIFDKITTISMEFHDIKNKDFTAEKLIKKTH